jgi:hypothetical protein
MPFTLRNLREDLAETSPPPKPDDVQGHLEVELGGVWSQQIGDTCVRT